MIYKSILKESSPKIEIVKYILGRIKGVRKKFKMDVIIKNNGIKINCGRIFENCSIACSYFENYLKKELNIENGIFIDVGSHVGKHSLYVAKKLGNRGRVLSIEANNWTAELLKKSAKLNNFENIRVYEYVCSDKNGEVIFFNDEFHTATNSIYKKAGKEGVKKISVRLDDLFPSLRNVRLIKIDVEGAESRVIDGAKELIKNNRPKIIFEAWSKEQANLIKEKLASYNYKIRHIQEDNYAAEAD